MNREIKFRAWDKESWSEDDGRGEMWHNIRLGGMGSNDGMSWYNTDEGYFTNYYSDDVVWMQYIGLKDKNGREIYEGDVVMTNKGTEDENTYVVVFEKGRFCHRDTENMSLYTVIYHSETEVIGNIYENSELLKEVDDEN